MFDGFKKNSMFVTSKSNQVMNNNNGQSATKSLSITMYEKGSTTIPRKGSTLFNRVEMAHFKFYSLYKGYCINTKLYMKALKQYIKINIIRRVFIRI